MIQHPMGHTKPIEIPSGGVQCLAFEADGYHLFQGDYSGNIYRWKFETGTALSLSAIKAQGSIRCIVTSKDGQWIAGGDSGNNVNVWSTVTKQVIRHIPPYYGTKVCAIDVSSDAKVIAVALGEGWEQKRIRIVDIMSGNQVREIYIQSQGEENIHIVGVKFSPDGDRIATAISRYAPVRVFDVHSGRQLFEIPVYVRGEAVGSPPGTPFAWSPDSKQLFVGSPGTITCLDTSISFRSHWSIQNTEENVSIMIHGQFIACSAGSSLSFWDYTSREQIGSIVDDVSPINCIAISYDGRYLACGRVRAITVYDLGDILPRDYLRVPLVSPMSLVQVSNPVLTSWTLGSATETERMLSEALERGLRPKQQTLAARSLIRARLKKWRLALEDAEKSLQIEKTPLGRIARSFALVGAGKSEDALYGFDLVFHDRTDRSDNTFLLVVKSILLFLSGKHPQAISYLHELIDVADVKIKDHYRLVLAYMYLQQRDFGCAVQTLELAKMPLDRKYADPLMTITLIFNWKFDNIKVIAWERFCQSLYATSSVREVAARLLAMVQGLPEDEREATHGRILEAIIARSGQVTLLEWIGTSSKCNSCLPSSPTVYARDRQVLPGLDEAELVKRTEELRATFSLVDAILIYGQVIRLQPVLFVHFRLLLPCIVFDVKSIAKVQGNVYRAEAAGLSDVEFTTADALLSKEPRCLVFGDIRIHNLVEPHSKVSWECDLELDMESGGCESGTTLAHDSIIEEVPATSTPVDPYTRALRLIAHLGQPFNPLLFLRRSDGTYKRAAADSEIVVPGIGDNFVKDIRVEVLEIR